MFKIKKIILFAVILFFIFIPKVSAKYSCLEEFEIIFELEIPEEPEKYCIYNLDDLLEFREKINSGETSFEGVDVYLMDDIDLSSIPYWISIGSQDKPFKGTFYGNSHTISNMNINNISHYMGLFGKNSGTITELTVTGEIRAHTCEIVGGIVGENNGTISYSNSKVNILGSAEKIGGIAGLSEGGSIEHCINYNTVSGARYSGRNLWI